MDLMVSSGVWVEGLDCSWQFRIRFKRRLCRVRRTKMEPWEREEGT